ncbi:partial tRNA(Glu)-specific nuclease WapA, partial [Anaerolineae bacterium]
TNALGYTRVYTYDAAGNQMATQDERGFVTTTVFDGLNRAIAQTDALGQTRYTLYDAAGQTMAEIDYQGYATQRLYDATGNVIQTTDALSNTTTSEYDPLGRAISVTDPLSHTRRTAYDAAGRVVSETTPLGYTTIYTYNAEGWQTARLDPLGQVWATTFDQAGRPLVETDPLNRATRTEYDLLGRVDARVDALDRRTTYTYDPAGRLLTVTAPDGTTQRYTYDSTGNFLTEQDGNAHVTRYQYDLLGRQLRKTDPLGRIWQYRYDASGNQTGVATPYGHLLTQTYDELGRLTARLYDGVQNAAYGYDANGNRAVMTDTLGVTVYTYDALNRLTDSSDAAGRTAHYGYDAVGQRVQLTYPDGTVAHYAYDADGRLQQVTAPDGGVTHYSNDALGRTTRVVQGNGVTVETTYDGVGNALAITQRDSSNAIFAEQRFVVDAVNRRTQEVELLPQGTVTTTYAYDDLDHLTTSSASDGRITHYSFDNAGNRLAQWGTRTRNGALENFRTDYAYNPANQLLQAIDTVLGTTSYTYDADGNRTNQTTADRHLRLQYDAANRLVQAKVEIQQNGSWSFKDGVYERYGYDGDGRRVRKETWSGLLNTLNSQRDYRYDDTRQWDVLQSYNSAQPSAPNRYLYDQSLHKLAYWQGAGSGYLQNDSLGSVLGSTNLSGTLAAPSALMKYSDYGESLTVNAPLLTDDAFTGYELDAYSGLQYARYRYYDAATGSFITSDPFPADRQDVGDLHRYLYVQANPANDIDPLGLFRWTSASAGVIERGDTLWSIAAAYWRVSPYKVNWGMISAIQSANSWIKNPALIYAGYTLRLPTGVSASQSTAYLNQSAISDGTSESSCGQKPNSSSGSNNKNTSGSNKNNSANKSSNGTNNGTNTSQPTITDDTRGSPAWGLFNALTSELGVKVNSKKYRLDIPKEGKMSFNVPPLPVIGFAGGKFEFWFKFAAYMKFYWSQEKALAESARTGWCGGVGASAELEGSIPLWGPIRFGAWGAIEGEVGACTRGSWVSKNNLRIYLEPYGKIKGQIGAKLFLGLDLYVLGAKVSGEAGVKGSVNAEADFTKLQIWAELGPYVKGSAKIFGREVEGAWEKMFSTPRTTVQYSNFAKMFR